MNESQSNAESEHLPRRRALWKSIAAELGPISALLAIVAFFAVADQFWGRGHFTDMRNLRVVFNEMSIVAVAALGMTIIIIAGGIDLSAGTALALCATVMAFCLKNDVPVAITVAATIGVGCLCGLLNGVLVSVLRVVPFIVTLGTMTIFLGCGKIIAVESTVSPDRATQIPAWLLTLCSTRPPDYVGGFFPNFPLGVWGALGLAALVMMILHFTVFGRYVFAMGSSEATARLCGVNIWLMKIAIYTLAGFFVGIAGMYHFATLKIGNPIEGVGLELQIIAAVVIGGGSLSGGRGSVVGTLTGAAIMAVIDSGCDQLGIRNPYQDIIIGAIIISAVAADQLRQWWAASRA